MIRSRENKLAIDKFENETIIVDFETGIYYSLRGSASTIWELCETGLDHIRLGEIFTNITHEQQQQAFQFIEDLKTAKLVLEVEEEVVLQPVQHHFEEILFEQYKDMEDLIILDPIHEVDEKGWPHKKA